MTLDTNFNLILPPQNDFEVSDSPGFWRVEIAGNTPREITGNNDSLQELARHIASLFKLGSLLLELICLNTEYGFTDHKRDRACVRIQRGVTGDDFP